MGNLSRAFDYYVEIGELDRAVAIAENLLSAPFGHRTGMAQIISRALVLVRLIPTRLAVSCPTTSGSSDRKKATTTLPKRPWAKPWLSPNVKETQPWSRGP